MNNVTLIGRLTRNPELRYTPNKKTPVARFRLAVNEYDFVAGKEIAYFFEIVQYGPRAEALAKHVGKGRMVGVNGKLIHEQWNDKDSGEYRSKVFVQAIDIDWLPEAKNGQAEPDVDDEPTGSADHGHPARTVEDVGHDADDSDDELPDDAWEPGPDDEPF